MHALLMLSLFVASAACKSSEPEKKKPTKTRPKIVAPKNLDEFFKQDYSHSIKLELNDEAIAALLKSPRKYVEGTFIFGKKKYPVSVKLKGNRSFRKIDNKPALKIRFDKQDPNARFFGLRRLTLNNMIDDPTRMREALGYHIYRLAGVPAPRTAYTFLNINDTDFGIYLALEPVDEVFVETHFSAPIGGLYEAEYGCDLYPSDIKNFERDGGPKKSRKDLAAIAKVAATGSAALLSANSEHFDSEAVLSYLAVSTLLGDFDGYWHSHNYYLYQNGKAGKWLLLPWGIDRVFNDKLAIYGSHGRLAEVCFAARDCRLRYSKRLLEVASLMEKEQLDKEMRRLFAIMGPSANGDPRDDDTSLKKRHKKKRLMREFIKERPGEMRDALRCIVDGKVIDPDNDGFGCDDCAIDDATIHPGATEVCDGADNDCNGLIDDGPDCPCKTITSGEATFHLCKWRLSWSEANDFCQSKGLSLARIDTAEQSKAILKAALKIDDNRWWFGATDIAKEGTWLWADGTDFRFNYWDSGQPNNNQCGQDCSTLDDVGGGENWVDSHCQQNFPFVCR